MKDDLCSIDGCNKKVRSGSICEIHWWRYKKYNSYELPIKSKICKIETCENLKDRKYNICSMHRSRKSKYKSYELPKKKKLPEGIAMICINHGERTNEQTIINKPGKKIYIRCKECKEITRQKFLKKNPNYIAIRNFYFIGKGENRIKINIKDYQIWHELQNGLCKICNQPETYKTDNNKHKKIKRLSIDHCHKTNKIRGLLCQNCNTSLGGFKDSIDILQAAINYLKSS